MLHIVVGPNITYLPITLQLLRFYICLNYNTPVFFVKGATGAQPSHNEPRL